MNNRPGLSIIICTWNRAESLRATLLSLNEQRGCIGHDVEVVVVDNNSTDHTKQIVDALATGWSFGRLRYTFEPRQGKQFALNTGISFCSHSILAFTDDDVIFTENWALEILRTFSIETIDLVGGKTLITWPATGQPAWYHENMRAILGDVDNGDERIVSPLESYSPAGANLIARRRLFERIGGFAESHFRHMDYEFGMRSKRMGATISYEPTLVVYAPVDSACLTKKYFRRWAFKAGIARDGEPSASGATFLSVPRWVYRQLLEDFSALAFRGFSSSAADNFSRELRIWRHLGKVASRWNEILRPSSHALWVEKHSQKKKNVY
jgi:glycosyltransferase involved in cell wall biosynthesis